MESIGRQVKLPLATALQIALQGIRIRLGRAVVTITGVILGIAFLMSVLTGAAIKQAVSQEREMRQQVDLMMTLVKNQMGNPKGKRLAIAAFGTLSREERSLVQQVLHARPASVRGYAVQGAGITQSDLAGIGKDAQLLLILGNGAECPSALADMTRDMKQRVVLDTLDGRTYAGSHFDAARNKGLHRELFFNADIKQMEAEKKKAAMAAQFRTVWITIISLLVTVIGVANALLMSVTERFKEIGTMKCLGALSSFIRRLFLIESAMIGFVGSLLGVILGAVFPIVAYGVTFGFESGKWSFDGFRLVMGALDWRFVLLGTLGCIVVGTLLSILAAIYPANFAARMVPASALRSNV